MGTPQPLKAMQKHLIAITMATMLAACAGTPINWDQARQVKPGMSTAQTIALMGKPYSIKSTSAGEVWVWVFVDAGFGTKTYSIEVANDVVTKTPPIPTSFK